ncbi:hypothetical protein [Candidatus Symbiobacter mobilis]|uniref:ZipA FtsZ-binding region protein n=1 Tax=Candidatus Symbiobacter mobilis CR TaxID=946483 RepID=U5N6A1_9BURK|nr:hypothetical protein [Candidatus Symbiobacter mobilis]AGX87051.1 ZipA FtsZ-binding region protein [Candidatus Symbiobacter mobilis CR]
MDALQTALTLFGGLVLVALGGYTYWQFRRNATLHAPHRSTLRSRLEGVEDVEPSLVDHPITEDGAAQDAAIPANLPAHLPTAAAPSTAPGPAPRPAACPVVRSARFPRPALNEVIDLLIPISVPAPVAGHTAMAVMPDMARVGTKAFAIEGWNETRQRWEGLQADQRYGRLRAGVQLVDRAGSLTPAELVECEEVVRRCANAIHGVAEHVAEDAVLARAQDLYQFACAHDGRLFFQLRVTHGAWGVDYVQEIAREMGFVPGAVLGKWVLPSATTSFPVLGLQFDVRAAWADTKSESELHQIELGWEIALVPRSEAPFQRLRTVSAAMAAKLGAAITDEAGVALHAEAMEDIAQQIDSLYDTMDQRAIPAGSDLARRLCS